MVADDPFHEPPSGAERKIATPILRITSEADLTHYTPDGPTPPPAALVAATSTHESLSHSNLSEVNDALERFRHHRDMSASSAPSSSSDHQRHMHHDEDYDYRLDRPDEDGDEERLYEDKLLSEGINDHIGQYVAPGETDGLPSPPEKMEGGPRHTNKWSMLRRRVRRGSVRQTEGSVLSSLLALYGRHTDSGLSSHATSGDNTPIPSDDSDLESRGLSRRSHEANGSTRSPTSRGFKGKFQRTAQTLMSDRPKAARSDAGVFGALVGATGGLAASAAPNSTTLVPVAKRSGYHLTRYSLPGTPQHLSSPRTSCESRPSSLFSNTAVMDDKVELPSRSTDNLLMMEKSKSSQSLKDGVLNAAHKWIKTPTGLRTPTEEERRRKEWEGEKRRRKKAKEQRKKQEVFIVQHVAEIVERQQFLLKLARALMMFGSPTHRLETQIQATARVLEMNVQVVYLPGTMLVSFGDDATHTSETKFLKQTTGLDLGKLHVVHGVYWNVVHDRCNVEDASRDLDELMLSKPQYSGWQIVIISMMCSAFIAVPAFNASFIDALMCAALGGLLALVQMLAAMNDMFSNVFEIVIATLISFVAAVLSDTNKFCYTALVSGGVVLILPGFIVLTGALELASRNITAGSVRIGYAVIYSLFLGFGISMGGEIYFQIRHKGIKNAADYTCKATHVAGAPWYMSTPSGYWQFLCVPMYALCLSLRNGQPLLRKETLVMMVVASAGWSANRFTGPVFENRADITSAIGSFCVGIIGNVYGRFNHGSGFPVMVTGILMQLPSGLSQGGLFSFAAAGQAISESNGTTGTTTAQYSQGFQVAEQLVSVAIGLTVGLFVAAVVTHPLGGSRRRGGGIFSF
ncbi:hypothetical protein CspHIS471_0609080 [Cutaneotrichosporon sp. HIS471]|nr:hypothetical protein CspHIS471_0609080 [Cutaneotrichosporon sp. HIS471]